jgi:hypothetical protein
MGSRQGSHTPHRRRRATGVHFNLPRPHPSPRPNPLYMTPQLCFRPLATALSSLGSRTATAYAASDASASTFLPFPAVAAAPARAAGHWWRCDASSPPPPPPSPPEFVGMDGSVMLKTLEVLQSNGLVRRAQRHITPPPPTTRPAPPPSPCRRPWCRARLWTRRE